jgi:hypothetical protein
MLLQLPVVVVVPVSDLCSIVGTAGRRADCFWCDNSDMGLVLGGLGLVSFKRSVYSAMEFV